MPRSNGGLLSLIILLSVSSSVFSSPVFFKRPDPLNHFKAYDGGFDIKNKHYWSSALFTGVHGYAMAGIWIVGGLGFGVYVILKNHYGNSCTITEHSDYYYLIPFMVLLLCTFLVIIASSFAFATSQRSMLRAQKLKRIILQAATDARRSIRKVVQTMHRMQHVLRPYNEEACSRLELASRNLQQQSQTIQQQVSKHHHLIDLSIKIWYGTTVGVVAVNLILAIAALVLLLLHWRPGFIMIITLCWILTALCWILTGFQFFLHTFVDDTCSSFKDYQQNPGNNSLSSILPCVNEDYSNQVMAQIGSTVYKFVTKLNSQITSLLPILLPKGQKDEWDNGFGPICNPFYGPPDYNINANACPEGTIQIKEIPNIMAKYTCYGDNSTTSCLINKKFIPEDSYNMAWAYSQTIQDLLSVYPDLEDLTACSIVKDTVSDALSHHCTPLKISLNMLWSSMIALSVTMLVLELVWISKACQNKGRSFSRFSVIPIRENVGVSI